MHESNEAAGLRQQKAGGTAVVTLTQAHVARTIELFHQCGADFRIPLLRALAQKQIALCEVPRGEPFPAELAKFNKLPVITIFCDDDHWSSGPGGFPCAKRFSYWARRIMVHAAGGEPQHYELAIEAARLCRHILIVETDSAHEEEWFQSLGAGKRAPILCVTALGGAHPVLPPREAAQ